MIPVLNSTHAGATGLPLENLGGSAKVHRREAVWSLGHRESPFEGYVCECSDSRSLF